MTVQTWAEVYEAYDEYLNGVHGEIHIGQLAYLPARVLLDVDPIAYRCGFNDWADGEDIDTDELTGNPDRH